MARHLMVAAVLVVVGAPALAQQAPADPPRDSVTVRTTPVTRDSQPMPPTDGALGRPLFAPVLSYAPETGVGAGASVFAVTEERRRGQRPDTWGASLVVTQRGQFLLNGTSDVWTRDNRWRIASDVAAVRFPNRFFGLGSETPALGERYVPTTLQGGVSVQRAVRRGLYLGVRASADRTVIREVEPAGQLATFAERDGWTLLTLGGSVVHDTRERLFAPRRGALRSLSFAASDPAFGSGFTHTRVTVDAREYVPVTSWLVVAAQARVDHVAGGMPFDRLPQLGGASLLRGYFAGRFRDKSLGIGQAELRLGPWLDAIGVTLFAAAGGAAPTLDALRDTRFRRAAGGGLRLVANPASGLALRIDYGVGEQGNRGWYISVGEAF